MYDTNYCNLCKSEWKINRSGWSRASIRIMRSNFFRQRSFIGYLNIETKKTEKCVVSYLYVQYMDREKNTSILYSQIFVEELFYSSSFKYKNSICNFFFQLLNLKDVWTFIIFDERSKISNFHYNFWRIILYKFSFVYSIIKLCSG